MLRQLCDELANEKAVQCPHLSLFVKRAHTNHLNEKYMTFFFIICTVCYNTNLKYPSYKRTNVTFNSDYTGYNTHHRLQFHLKPEFKDTEKWCISVTFFEATQALKLVSDKVLDTAAFFS